MASRLSDVKPEQLFTLKDPFIVSIHTWKTQEESRKVSLEVVQSYQALQMSYWAG